MANFCFTNYVVEGKRETLEQIKDVINIVAKRYKDENIKNLNLSDILIGLGLYTEESLMEATEDYTEDTPEGLGIAGNWHDAEIKELNGNTVLTFIEEYKWSCSCDMETISGLDAFVDGITGVFRYSEESGCDIYETTDDEGKYFPEKYVLDMDVTNYEHGDYYIYENLLTFEHVQKMVHRFYPEIAIDANVEEMEAYAKEHDFRFICHEIKSGSIISAGEVRKKAQQIVRKIAQEIVNRPLTINPNYATILSARYDEYEKQNPKECISLKDYLANDLSNRINNKNLSEILNRESCK